MRKKLLLAMLLITCVVSAQDLWDGKSVASQFHGGSGTASDPYQIRTGAELMYFASLVNEGNDFSGRAVKLMNDISLGDHALEVTSAFAGVFDGNGHFIEQIFRSKAIFQSVSGVIKHLGVRFGVYRDDRYPYYGQIYLAQTVEEGGLIENCYHELSLKRNNYNAYLIDYHSFLVGKNSGIIRNCYATGNYTIYDAGGVWGGYIVGMLVDTNNATGVVENCAASTYNNGRNDRGTLQPLITTNNGTLIEGENTTLAYFAAPDRCNVEFIDTLFHTSTASLQIPTGQPIGSLPIPNADCTFIGWNRYGQLVAKTEEVNTNWTLFAQWEQRIRKQPTTGSMMVEVDDAAHASFQWYAIYGDAQQYGSWQSTNHSNESSSSDTLIVSAKAGQQLKFAYNVSSEQGSDMFTFYCNGVKMLTASGEEEGEFTYDIDADGTYQLVFRYTKDIDTRSGKDMVSVTNIRVVNQDNTLKSTTPRLSTDDVVQKGLYFCKITYSNTGVILSSDTISCAPGHMFDVTDVTVLTDAVYASAATVLKGSSGTLTVCLKNVQPTNAYSFDLVLPEGVTVEGYTLSSRHDGHVGTMNYNEVKGAYSFAALSLESKELTGSDGPVWTLRLKVADSVEAGDYAVKVQNAKYALTSGSTSVTLPDVVSLLTIEDYQRGDANGDGALDIADAVCVVNRVVGKETPSFIEAAADANGDGTVDIADAVRIVNIVVGKIEH